LSSSAFFRDSRRFVSNFETAIRLQGFSQAVDAAAGSSFHFIPASPACAAHLTRYGAHRLVPLLTGLRSWGLVRPSERCSSRRAVRNFVRTCPLVVLPNISPAPSTALLEILDRNFRAFVPRRSCGAVRGFYAANSAHAPVGFLLSKGLSRLARAVPPFPRMFSQDRGRLPLMRLSAATVRNRNGRAPECGARTDGLFRFRGAPPFIRFPAFSDRATKASQVRAAVGRRSDRT
jgi:hypothetical protein